MTMCSNSSSSGGCGCGGNSNGSCSHGSLWNQGLKKKTQQKRPRVPKRGPGVAELEKILREQEKDKLEGFTSSCLVSHKNPYNPHVLKSHPTPPPPPPPLPPPPSPSMLTLTSNPMTKSPTASNTLPTHVPLAPKFDHFNPATMTNIFGNDGHRGGSGASAIGGSGLVLPEEVFFPMAMNSCKPNIDRTDGRQSDSGNLLPSNLSNESNTLWPSPLLQKRNFQYPPAMINKLTGSSALSSSSSSSARMYSPVEPPSNQNAYYNYTSMPSEEQKMAGMKRPYPFSFDNSPVPPPDIEVPPNFTHAIRADQSFTTDNHRIYGLGSRNAISRDAKWGSSLEINSRNYISDYGVVSDLGNFLTISTPAVPQPPVKAWQGELPKYNVLPYQDDKENSSNHKPFYSFLLVKGQVKETRIGSDNEGGEAGDDGIDLSLKL
ncbi:Actin cytoskeleton-regulatory complex protein pan1, putative isoform 1 [Quillaja saponaria]|uniref:Actin cytoskeleton-regulatory complex protein pan1, putative isoform 1 n=1 Tax=Quillaja saponaria TaxID=32244 RepID=A0AAD7P9U5_QUISA|nr:Actin cytoskeleton-regulatory complex protein pan1, putative isoform 1 [Quillaja saponaria]